MLHEGARPARKVRLPGFDLTYRYRSHRSVIGFTMALALPEKILLAVSDDNTLSCLINLPSSSQGQLLDRRIEASTA